MGKIASQGAGIWHSARAIFPRGRPLRLTTASANVRERGGEEAFVRLQRGPPVRMTRPVKSRLHLLSRRESGRRAVCLGQSTHAGHPWPTRSINRSLDSEEIPPKRVSTVTGSLSIDRACAVILQVRPALSVRTEIQEDRCLGRYKPFAPTLSYHSPHMTYL